MIELAPHGRGTVLRVRAQPNARKNGVLGERAGALRVGVTAAPEKGKANAAIAAILAGVLRCRASEVVLLGGEAARDKRFLILELEPEAVRELLTPLIVNC